MALSVASALLILSAAPVAALTVRGHGHYARFSWGAPNGGIVIVDREGSSNPRVTVGIVQTYPANEYDFYPTRARSIGCGGTPSASNLLFSVSAKPDANGDLFFTKTLSSSINFEALRSIWVRRGTGEWACSRAVSFETLNVATGDVNANGFVAVWEQDPIPAIVAAEKRPNGQARVSIVVHGMSGDDMVRVRGVNRPCGQPVSSTNNRFNILLEGGGYSVHDIHINQGGLNSLRSVRFRNVDTGKNLGCAPLSIIMADT
jgi:hypothetical protein